MDLTIVQRWIEKQGFTSSFENATTLRLTRAHVGSVPPGRGPGSGASSQLPPFILQLSEHWVLLSILPVLAPDEFRPDDLGQRLLAANRHMRVAKFAFDNDGEVVLCAELPTESLDESELADAVQRMVQYAATFRAGLGLG